MQLGEIIRQFRTENGISQRQFAKYCGLTNGYISMLENGTNPKTGEKITPSIITLYKIADAMDITKDALMRRMDDQDYFDIIFTEKENRARSSPEEKELIHAFRSCSQEGRDLILRAAKAIAGNPNLGGDDPVLNEPAEP